MKAITFAIALCLLSSSAFSIGRPHNIFATHRAVEVSVANQNQAKKGEFQQPSAIKTVAVQAQKQVSETRKVFSMVGKIVAFFLNIIK